MLTNDPKTGQQVSAVRSQVSLSLKLLGAVPSVLFKNKTNKKDGPGCHSTHKSGLGERPSRTLVAFYLFIFLALNILFKAKVVLFEH